MIDNDDDEKMVSYTTRHVYYAMPRCLGPSHFFFFSVNPLIPPHAIRERAATDACTTRLRRLKHAATKDKRAGPTRAAACVRRSPLRPCPRSQSFQSPELHGGRVFSAECIPAFDWQSVGLFYSFYHSKQPGRITRLLACEDEQLRVHAPPPVRSGRANPMPAPAPESPRPAQVYPKVNLEMGPTFVHKNMRYDEMNEAEKFDQYRDGKGRGYASHRTRAPHAHCTCKLDAHRTRTAGTPRTTSRTR